MAEPVEVGLDRLREAQPIPGALVLGHHLDLEAGLELETGTRARPTPGLDQRQPLGRTEALDQQQLDPAARAFPVGKQTCGDHLGVVDHQQVAGVEQLREVGDPAVTDRPWAGEDQQAARAPGSRDLSDPIFGQKVVEIGGPHGGQEAVLPVRGWRRSRRPSPTRLKAITVSAIARPGKTVTHQAETRASLPSAIMLPQLGSGG